MTSDEIKQLQDIYDEAIQKMDRLAMEKQEIIKRYIKQLEDQKVAALREGLGLTGSNNQS